MVPLLEVRSEHGAVIGSKKFQFQWQSSKSNSNDGFNTDPYELSRIFNYHLFGIIKTPEKNSR